MDVVNFVLLVAALAVLWLAIFVGRPAIARARFSRDVSALRDEVADAILDGIILDSEDAEAFVDRATRVLDNPREFTMGHALALLSSARNAGIDMQKVGTPFKYESLPADDAAFLEGKDRRMVAILTRHFVDGSTAWFVLAPLRFVVISLARLLGTGAATGAVGSVSQIARETWGVGVRPGRHHRTA